MGDSSRDAAGDAIPRLDMPAWDLRLNAMRGWGGETAMPCLFALFAAFAPRLALFFVWIFTPLVSRAFGTFIVPLLGIIFLPFTTLMYVLVWSPVGGVTGWAWFWVILGLLLDLGSYTGSAYGNRNRIPGYTA